ncbi:MAG: tetratricopeptide repeat protein, partial [Bacteroidota bacterium]
MRTYLLFISLIAGTLNLTAQSVEKHLEKGIEYYNDSAYSEALDHFQNVLKNDSTHSEALYYMGLIKSDPDKPDESIDYFSQAIEHNPQYGDAFRERGLAYEASGDT